MKVETMKEYVDHNWYVAFNDSSSSIWLLYAKSYQIFHNVPQDIYQYFRVIILTG